MAAAGAGSPCGACKFLRRKCLSDCIFAPYFCTEQGPARFAAIHKVFGASNASKLLLRVPAPDRCEAVVTIAYEAQSRLHDPVYGCVSHIFALQQQVAYLQAQIMQVKAQLTQSSRNPENQLTNGGAKGGGFMGFGSHDHDHGKNYVINHSISPQSSLDSIDGMGRDHGIEEAQICRSDHEAVHVSLIHNHPYSKKRSSPTDLCELQELALRMMNNDEYSYY